MVDAVSFMAKDHRVEEGDIKTKLQAGDISDEHH